MIDFKTLPISKRVYQETYPILLPVSEWEFKKYQKFWLVDNIFKEGGLDLLKEMAPVSYTHLTLPTKRIV